MPVGPSSGVTIRTFAPRLMSAVASFSWVASLPCALSIRNCDWVYPASAKASVRYGWSKLTHRCDDVVSGRTTPTCRLFAPLVAYWVSALNGDITDATSVEKESMLTFGTVFEPPDEPDPLPDEPQAAAARLTTAANPTQAARRERGIPPRLLLLNRISPRPLSKDPNKLTRDTIAQVRASSNYASVTIRSRH